MPNRILIIDDDKDLCRLLQESLRQMDAEADVCYSGNVGISFMQKRESVSYTHLTLPTIA